MNEIGETPREVAEAKVELPSTERVLSKLKPRQVEAAEGSVHTIYTFENKERKPVEILFFSPNELPLVKDEVEGKLVVINGNDPRWRSNEEWEDFSLGILRASENDNSTQQSYEQQVEEAVDSGRGILLVETGPEAVLETAEQLGIAIASLKEILKDHGFTIKNCRSDVVNFSKHGGLKSKLLAQLFPSLGRTIICLLRQKKP